MTKAIRWPWPALHGPRAALWLASLHRRTTAADCLVEAAVFLQTSKRKDPIEGHRKPDSPLWRGSPEQRFAACLQALKTLDRHTTTQLADAEALRRTAHQTEADGWLNSAGRLHEVTTLAHVEQAVVHAAQTAAAALDHLGEALIDIEAAASRGPARSALQTHAAWRVALALTADPETLGRTFALGGSTSGHGQGELGLGNALTAITWSAALDLVLQRTGQLEPAEEQTAASMLNRWTAAAAACGDGSLKTAAALQTTRAALTRDTCPWWACFLLAWLAEQLSPPLCSASTPAYLGDPIWRHTPDALALLEALRTDTPAKAEKPTAKRRKLAFDLESRGEADTPERGTPEGLQTFLGLAECLAEQLLASPHILRLTADAELREQLAPPADAEVIAAEAMLEISSTRLKLANPQGRTTDLEQLAEGGTNGGKLKTLNTLPPEAAETFGKSLSRIAVKYMGLFTAARWGALDAQGCADELDRQTVRGTWPAGTAFVSLVAALGAELDALIQTTLNTAAGLPTPRSGDSEDDRLWPVDLAHALGWTRWVTYDEDGDNLFVKVQMPRIHADLEDADGKPWIDAPVVEDILRPAAFATLCAMWDSCAAFSALAGVPGALLKLQTPTAVAARQQATAAARAAVQTLLNGQTSETGEGGDAWMRGVSLVDCCLDCCLAACLDDADGDADDADGGPVKRKAGRRKAKPWISTMTIAGKTAAEGGSLAKLGQTVREARWTWLKRQASDGFSDLVLLRSDAST